MFIKKTLLEFCMEAIHGSKLIQKYIKCLYNHFLRSMAKTGFE